MANQLVFDYPWEASMCGVCRGWFTKAGDLVNHVAAEHRGMELRFRCGRCGSLSSKFRGVAIHYAKCREQEPAAGEVGDHACTECGRRFTTQAGLTIHRNGAHPEERNAERVEAAAPRGRALRAGAWSHEEDQILIERYLACRRGGGGGRRRVDYSTAVAADLPLKTDVQVRQRVRTLKAHGLLGEPDAEPGPVGEPVHGDPGGGAVVPPGLIEPVAPPSPPRPVQEVNPNHPGNDFDDLPEVAAEAVAAVEPLQGPPVPVETPVREEAPAPALPPGPAVDPGALPLDPPGADVWDTVLDHIRRIRGLCPIGERLLEFAERGVGGAEELDEMVDELQQAIMAGVPVRVVQRRPREAAHGHRHERTQRRVARYARTQELFKRNPSRLAGLVLEENLEELDGEFERVSPPADATRALYEQLWGAPGHCSIALAPVTPADNQLVRPFDPKEILARMRALKPGGAPGLDGVTKAGVMSRQNLAGTLAILFNIVLFRGLFPSGWSKNRTVLIPKAGKDLSEAANWRPITIAPLLARLYSGVIENRLLQFVTLSDRQRGFRPGCGCAVNCTILDEVIRLGKRTEIVGVQLDVSKAFDTVSHKAIDQVLVAQGVPSVLRGAVRHMYSESTTLLGSLGVEVPLKRGVKQGDPLSPLLFNLVLDPLLVKLQRSGVGFPVGTANLAVMAYADDITLFATTVPDMEGLIKATAEYLHDAGMGLSIPKCVSFWVRALGDAWVAHDAGLSLDGQAIRPLRVDESFKYLGLNYTLAKGFANRDALSALERAVGAVKGLSLKPQQKVSLLMQYIVPTISHRCTINPPSSNDLKRVDATLRHEVKRIMHLPECTTNEILYARKRDGGLGFPRLEHQLKLAALRVGQELLWSGEEVLVQLRAVTRWEARYRGIAEQLGVEWPPNARTIALSKRRTKQGYHARWAGLGSQGVGVEWFREDPIGNHWLLNQSCLRPGQFIDALKMRANVYGTRVAINRATHAGVTACRRCLSKPETLGHITGQCTAGATVRVERHNAIARTIREAVVAQGCEVAREQEFDIDGLRLRPDLVVKRNDQALVVDVTVRFENGPSLAEAALEKKTKYAPVVQSAQRLLAATKGEVIPVVVGARGAMPRSTITALAKLGITRQASLLDISLLALRSSLEMARQHLDYG